jgi:two-component system LytT family response regulator
VSDRVLDVLDVLVVDDEPLARRGLRELLAELPNVSSVREAVGGAEAVRAIEERRPDLVFLDVQMPRVDGFGVIEAVGASRMPPVVFVTAYDEHAVRAFEVHAVDYLLKPVDPERFRDAFDHAARAASRDDVDELRAALAAVVPLVRRAREGAVAHAAPAQAAPRSRIAVQNGRRVAFVAPDEILWVEALGNYVNLHVRGGAVRHRATMDEMEAALGAAFVRVRRSALVRAAAVRWCEPMGKGSWLLVLEDGTRLTSSRYFREQLDALLGGR